MKNPNWAAMLALALTTFAALSFQTLQTTVDVSADPPRWEMLGMRKVNYTLDRDEILVTRSEGIFNALKVKVKAGPLNMHKIVVHFGNGQTEELEVRENFQAGGESRVLDLPGNQRIIRKVVFWYDTKNLANRKAVVQLWGRH